MESGGHRRLFLAIDAVIAVFVLVCFALPFFNPYGTLVGLDGHTNVLDHKVIWDTLDPVSSLFYTLGDYTCHQEMSRSLLINGNQMPFCVRDVFLFIGFIIGFAVVAMDKVEASKKTFIVGVILVAITLPEWALEHYEVFTSNLVRAVVSIISAAGAPVCLYCIYSWETAWLEKAAERKKGKRVSHVKSDLCTSILNLLKYSLR